MIEYRKVRHWQWLLDTGLPGDFGQIGEWLNQGEVSSCTTCRDVDREARWRWHGDGDLA